MKNALNPASQRQAGFGRVLALVGLVALGAVACENPILESPAPEGEEVPPSGTAAPPMPGTPSITTTALSADSFAVSATWTRPAGAARFDWRSGANAAAWETSGTRGEPTVSFRAPRLAGANGYWFCVHAVSASGSRSAENACNAYAAPAGGGTPAPPTPPAPPAPPTPPAPPAPPVPPAPPSSGTVVFQEGFESGGLSAWNDRGLPANHRVVSNPSLARSGSHVLEMTYPAGSSGGGFLTRFLMPGYDSVLVSFWNRYPEGWRSGGYLVGVAGSRTDNQWSAFGKAGVCPGGSDFFFAYLYAEYGGNPGPASFYTYHPDMPRTGGCYGDTGPGRATYPGPRTLTPGGWHRVDLWVKLNTPGQRNGVQRMWIDGVLAGEWTGMRFRDSHDLRLNSVMITAQQSMGAPQTQVRYVDDIVVTANAGSPR